MIVLSKDFHFTGDSFQFLEASSALRSDLHKNCQPPIRCMIFHHLIALNHMVHPKKRNGTDFCKFWISESLSSEHVPAAGPAVVHPPSIGGQKSFWRSDWVDFCSLSISYSCHWAEFMYNVLGIYFLRIQLIFRSARTS